jgi:hypothetical protein
MDTDFFSGAKPSLISSKMMKDINKQLDFSVSEGPTWGQSIGGFYENYIKPNIFPIAICVMFAIFLLIRYLIKKDKDKDKYKKSKKDRYPHVSEYRDNYGIPDDGRFIHNDNEYAIVNGKKYEYNEFTGKYQPIQETSSEDDYSIEDKLRDEAF